MRLLSGEKTPLCKNICCGNGCQTPFCGLCLCAEIVICFDHLCGWKHNDTKSGESSQAVEQSTVGLFILFFCHGKKHFFLIYCICGMHIEACHENKLFHVKLNNKALRVI